MSDTGTEPAPTEELSRHAITAFRALSLIHATEDLIDDMHQQVDQVEAMCAATRKRIARRHRDG